MYIGQFRPADPVEDEPYGFDFRKDLAKGELLNTVEFLLSAIDGIDDAPETRLIGAPEINGTKVKQRIAGLLPGVIYRLQAVVVTSRGSTKSLWGRVTCSN
jgi:hypothetical protein